MVERAPDGDGGLGLEATLVDAGRRSDVDELSYGHTDGLDTWHLRRARR